MRNPSDYTIERCEQMLRDDPFGADRLIALIKRGSERESMKHDESIRTDAGRQRAHNPGRSGASCWADAIPVLAEAEVGKPVTIPLPPHEHQAGAIHKLRCLLPQRKQTLGFRWSLKAGQPGFVEVTKFLKGGVEPAPTAAPTLKPPSQFTFPARQAPPPAAATAPPAVQPKDEATLQSASLDSLSFGKVLADIDQKIDDLQRVRTLLTLYYPDMVVSV
jgi:hypothetical protein